MSDNATDEWDRQGTPHEVGSDWDQEQSEYGSTMSPAEWDDYSSDQSVPVAPPRPRPAVRARIEPAAVPDETPDTSGGVAGDEVSGPVAEVDETAESDDESGAVAATREADEESGAAEEPGTAEEPEPAVALGDEPASETALLPGLFRDEEAQTQVIETPPAPADPVATAEEIEEQRMQAFVDSERQARNERLGVVATSPENATRPDPRPVRISTDGFPGSFGLFVLRQVTAAVVGVIGYQILSGIDQAAELLGRTLIPEPRLVSWILGFTLLALALLLVIGLLQRVVGFLLVVIAVGSLAFLRWGPFNPFQAGIEGFRGDRDLLLAAVGLVLLGLGGGLWGLDGAFRRSRAKARAARQG